MHQLVGDRFDDPPPRARHPRGLQAEDEDVVELGPLRRVHRQHAHGRRRAAAGVARRRSPRPASATAASERANSRGVRLGRRRAKSRGELAEPRQRAQPLDDVGLRGEQLLAAQARAARRAGGRTGPAASCRAPRRPGGAASGSRGRARAPRAAAAATRWRRRAPLTMSSLRRREIWMQRARSAARSSIGGRASARTTAPASEGSTSSRSQARTSRTSARAKNAARAVQPVGHRALLERDGRPPGPRWRTERTSTAMPLGRGALAHEPLDLGRHGLGLRALVGAAPEPHARRARAPSGRPAAWRSGRGSATTASRAAHDRRGQRSSARGGARWRRRQLGGEVAQVLRRPPRAARGSPGRRRRRRSGRRARAASSETSSALREARGPGSRRRARGASARRRARARAGARAAARARAARGRRGRARPARRASGRARRRPGELALALGALVAVVGSAGRPVGLVARALTPRP